MTAIKKIFQYGDRTIMLETGRVAKQASSVMVTMGETVILVAAVAKKEAVEGQDFFPLTVNYQERTYAAGKIPGGYFKREARPSEKETLTSRLIDRAMRPMFPKGFCNEIQIVATVMSLDSEVPADIPAMIGASAALAITGAPFMGPVGAARVGMNPEGELLLNPNNQALETSSLDLVVAGTEKAVLMVESEAKQLSEEKMLSALRFAHDQMQVAIQAIKEFAQDSGTTQWHWTPPAENTALIQAIKDLVFADLESAYQIKEKADRYDRVGQLRDQVVKKFVVETDENAPGDKEVKDIFSSLEKNIVRSRILNNQPRIDGRDTLTVRPITIELGILPRVHGSVLFTRGETQAIVTVTLGSERDGQIIDALEGEYKDNFMLHYNFPPYCVGETGFMSGPKRREIGHGRLARRGLEALVPSLEEFPYTLRVVSEITESNGSSSMASVCGGSLAMMDAGVPVKSHVAGIAMGLIKEGDQFAVLTDILGDEDHLGDMDFKVAGTRDGVTALQMDIKIDGITFEIMDKALNQAKDGRMHILGLMEEAITGSRENLSKYAPTVTTLQIRPEQIREVIGKGGETIKSITEATGVTIDISDTGLVKISAVDGPAGEAALAKVKEITMDIEAGMIFKGKVARLMDFGAFVTLKPGKDGLVHISQIADERVEKVEDYVKEGQEVTVKVLEIDRQGRIKLTMKDVETAETAAE